MLLVASMLMMLYLGERCQLDYRLNKVVCCTKSSVVQGTAIEALFW